MKQSPKRRVRAGSVNIKVGDTVKWTNPYIITHTVTFDPAQAQTASDVALPAGVAPFGSGNIEEDGTFQPHLHREGHLQICLQVS